MTQHSDLRIIRSFGRNIWMMLAVFAISGFGYFGVYAVLFNLYLLRLGYDAQFIGSLIGFGQLVWALMALPAGALGRRWGSRVALPLWQGLHGVGFALILLAQSLPAALMTPCIVLGWTIFWIGGAFGGANSTPYMMRMAPAGTQNLVFSAQVLMFSVMGFLGSWVAGVLPAALTQASGAGPGDPAPYRLALLLTPLCNLLCVPILMRLEHRETAPLSGTALAVSRPLSVLLFWGLLMFLLTASEGSVRAFFNVYLEKQLGMSTAEIGQVFGLAQFVSILGAFGAPVLLRNTGAPRLILLTTLASGLALLMLGLLPSVAVASLAYVGVLLLSALSTAARSIMSQQLVHLRWRTIVSAVQTLGLGLGWASAAAIGGVLVTAFGFATYFSISAGLAFVAALLLFGFLRRGGAEARE